MATATSTLSNELRVGIMFLTGLVLLVLAFISLTRWRQDRGTYYFYITFSQVQGLQEGGEVRLAGVKVGYVDDLSLESSNNNLVRVRARVQEGVILYEDYTYTIGMGGLVGERYVDIRPTENGHSDMVRQGDTVAGLVMPDINDVMANANMLVNQLRLTTESFNNVLGDPVIQRDLRATLTNLNQASENATRFTAGLDQMLQRNGTAVDLVLANMADVSSDLREVSDSLAPQLRDSDLIANMNEAAASVARITARVENIALVVDEMVADKTVAASLRDTLKRLNQASADLESALGEVKTASTSLPRIAANVEKASADLPEITKPFREIAPDTAQDVREIARSLRATSEEVGGVAQRVSRAGAALASVRVETEARLLTMGRDDKFRSDLNADLRYPSGSFRVGVADIGNSSRVNLQFGEPIGTRGLLRTGVIQSRFGVGMDYWPNPDLRLTGEVFDPGNLRANALVDWRLRPLGDDIWLSAGWYDLFDRSSLGLGVTFKEK